MPPIYRRFGYQWRQWLNLNAPNMDTRIQNIIQGVTNAEVDEYAELIGRAPGLIVEGEQMARQHRYGITRNAEEQARFLVLRGISDDRAFTDPEAEEWNRLSEMDEPPPVPRTGEQELRYLYLQSRIADYVASDEEQGEYNTLRGLGNYEGPPLRKRINVIVSKTSGGDWRIRVRVNYQNVDLPPWKVIKGLLPVQHHQFLPTGRVRDFNVKDSLSRALNNGLSAAILHEALKGWITAVEREQPNIETETGLDDETAGLLRAMPATLEVGGKVYKLIPAGEADVSPLIKRVRNKALAGAKAESLAIVQRASTDAQIVINQATQRRRQIEVEIERARAASGSNPIPEWVRTSAKAHKWVNGENLWHVELGLSCVVTEIRLTARHWNCVLFWRPRPFAAAGLRAYRVWLRLRPGGVYSLEDIYNKEYPTTHIAERCCMDLQGLPPAITSQASVRLLESALSRGLSVVNLSSPLNHHIDNYWPDFREQIPEGVREYLRGNYRIDVPNTTDARAGRLMSMEAWSHANPSRVTWDRVVRIEEEANETFVVGDPRITAANAAHPTIAVTPTTVEGIYQAFTAATDLALAAGDIQPGRVPGPPPIPQPGDVFEVTIDEQARVVRQTRRPRNG